MLRCLLNALATLSKTAAPPHHRHPLFHLLITTPVLHMFSRLRILPRAPFVLALPSWFVFSLPQQRPHYFLNNILFLKPLLQAEDHTGNCLLTQRASTLRSFPNGWVLPGGGAEAGESLFETGARELFEETGIVADKTSMRVMGLWESTFPHTAITGKPISHHHIVIYLHAKALPSSVLMLQKSEVQTACWLSRKQAQSIFAHYAEPDQLNTSFRAVKPGLSSTEDWDEKVHAEDSPPISLAALADRLTFGTRFALKLWIKLKLAPSNADGDDKIGNL